MSYHLTPASCRMCSRPVLPPDRFDLVMHGQVVASFCFGCYQPGRALLVTRTPDGIALKAVGEDTPAAPLIVLPS